MSVGIIVDIQQGPQSGKGGMKPPFLVLCSGRDSNPHGSLHTPLKRACLPIPPPELQLSTIDHLTLPLSLLPEQALQYQQALSKAPLFELVAPFL